MKKSNPRLFNTFATTSRRVCNHAYVNSAIPSRLDDETTQNGMFSQVYSSEKRHWETWKI